MFGRRCKSVRRRRADDGGGPRIGLLSKVPSHFAKVCGRWEWFVGLVKDAEISIDVSCVRLFDGFGELCLVPLRIFGGVNVKVPSLGEVLKPCRVHG